MMQSRHLIGYNTNMTTKEFSPTGVPIIDTNAPRVQLLRFDEGRCCVAHRNDNGELHRDSGPAVIWSNGNEERWFKGIRMFCSGEFQAAR